MRATKITIGDSTRGFDIAEMSGRAGNFRLVKGSIQGRAALLRRAVANLNRGQQSVVTTGGDELPIHVFVHCPADGLDPAVMLPIHGVEMSSDEVLRKVRALRETSPDKDVRYAAQVAINRASERNNLLAAVEMLRACLPAYLATL